LRILVASNKRKELFPKEYDHIKAEHHEPLVMGALGSEQGLASKAFLIQLLQTIEAVVTNEPPLIIATFRAL